MKTFACWIFALLTVIAELHIVGNFWLAHGWRWGLFMGVYHGRPNGYDERGGLGSAGGTEYERRRVYGEADAGGVRVPERSEVQTSGGSV